MARSLNINVDRIDDDTLRAAGLRDGQRVVAEPVDGGLLLRPDEDVIDRAAAEQVIAEHPATIDRLGR